MDIFLATYLNIGTITEPVRGDILEIFKEIPDTTTANIEAGRMIGGNYDEQCSIRLNDDGDLEITTRYSGPFIERSAQHQSYTHVITGTGYDFDRLKDAVLAYEGRHVRPLFGAPRDLPEGTFSKH